MKSIKSSTSTNPISRRNVKAGCLVRHSLRDKCVRLRTDQTCDKCFTVTCCQSVSFATCVRRHWLGFPQSNANFHQASPTDRLVGRRMGARCERRQEDRLQHHRQFTRRKRSVSSELGSGQTVCRVSGVGRSDWLDRHAVRHPMRCLPSRGTMMVARVLLDQLRRGFCQSPKWNASHAATRVLDCFRN